MFWYDAGDGCSFTIVAMTFVPGSYDFEIGRQVAKVVGVRHIAYPYRLLTIPLLQWS